MVSRQPRSRPPTRPSGAPPAAPRAKALGLALPQPLARALQRFREADADFDQSCHEHASVFRIDDRYAVLVARARELLSHARVLAQAAPVTGDDDESQLAAARVVAVTLAEAATSASTLRG
ncbi:MAG: hypothetical protein JNL79_10860 [Myxococcales bacterium]|nr:hypothetical protein [Myxococcales bacterium]